MLKELTQAFGVAGYEKEVRHLIEAQVKDYADELITDALGNLIVFKKGSGENKKRIMLTAHMDEIGLQIIKIEENGMIMMKTLGFLWISHTYMQRVQFQNGIIGILASKIPVEGVKEGDFTKLYVDIGATSKKEVLEHLKIGDVASYTGAYQELKGNRIMAKALDNRLGCYLLLEAIKRTPQPVHDVYYVFTVQEELGCRGAIVAAKRIVPDFGISVDITPAHDYPNDLEGSNTLGAGVAIKISDPSVICDEDLIKDMVETCEKYEIKYQYDVIYRGGTEASSINMAHHGIRAGAISVATRFPHSPNGIVQKEDIEAAISLISVLLVRPAYGF